MNALQAVGGGHLGFFNFEALLHIFQLGIQQIWIQHPSIVQKACVPKINTICLQHFKYAQFPEFYLVYTLAYSTQLIGLLTEVQFMALAIRRLAKNLT